MFITMHMVANNLQNLQKNPDVGQMAGEAGLELI